jgi:hypothetical protein
VVYIILDGRNVSVVNNVNYLGAVFDRKIVWILYLETIEAKAFMTFLRILCPFKIERLHANIKVTLHKALII